jgi:hypothetical protein
MDYPEQFLKGIPNKDFVGDDNAPTSDLFYFRLEHQKGKRNDNFLEESISWRDDSGADNIIFSQTKTDGAIHFKAGATVMCRHELDRLMKKPLNKDKLCYERREIHGNKYHGNLLLLKNVKQREMKKIAATIANVCFLEIIKNPNITQQSD